MANTSYLYHTNGLLESEDGPWANDTVSYGYTINRLRQSLSLKNSSGTLLWGQTNSYDAANRLTNLVSGAGAFVYQYPTDSASRRVQKLTLANHAFIDNTFDALARLTVTTLKSSNNAVLNTHQYGYNLAGQRTSLTNLNANRIDYGYDALGQLTYATGRESNNTLRSHEQLGYVYDLAGNLAQRNRNQLTTSLTVNNNNQLNTAGQSGSLTVAGRVHGSPTSVTVNGVAANVYSDGTFARTNLALPNGATNYTARATNGSATSIDTVRINLLGTVSFQYDDNGNLIRDGQRIMTYDAEDQLVGLVVTDGIYNLTQSGFIYDGLRRLRVRTEASWQANAWVTNQVVRYVYDGMQVLQEQDGSNQAQVTYTRGLDLSGSFSGAGGIGGLLARSHHSGQTVNHFYYYADGNRNVATLLNASQMVVAEYQYDPFGNLLSMRGVLAEGNLYRFSSKEYHPNSGLYYYGYRFYDPNLQRWLNRDPIGERGGLNLYAFVGNNPISRFDVLGLYGAGVNPAEKAWAKSHPICACAAQNSGKDIKAEMAKRYPKWQDNTVENAVQHCAWMCYVTSMWSCSKADAIPLGQAHENYPGNPAHDKAMDLHNNNVGANIGGKNLTDCFNKCEQAAKSHQLYWWQPVNPGPPRQRLPGDFPGFTVGNQGNVTGGTAGTGSPTTPTPPAP